MLHSHLGMTGAWGVYARPPLAPLGGARGSCSAPASTEVVEFDGPLLELMTEGRTRVRPAPGGARPGRAGRRVRRERFLRGCAPTTRRARSATRCSTSATSPGSATSGRPRGAGRRGSTRGGRSRSVTRRASCSRSIEAIRPRMLRSARAGPRAIEPRVYGRAGRPCPRCGARIARARAGRREPDDILVPGMSD